MDTLTNSAHEELNALVRQQAVIVNLGQMALTSTSLADLRQEVIDSVVQTLNLDVASVTELLPNGQSLIIRAGYGWQPGIVGELVVDIYPDNFPGYTFIQGKLVIVENWAQEKRFMPPTILPQHGISSSLSVPIQTPGQAPIGTLVAHTRQVRHFNQYEVQFFKAVANILAAASQRKQNEEALQELDLLKNLFVSVAVHELRTPLTTIKGYAELLVGQMQKLTAGGEIHPERYLQSAQRILSQSNHMARLINQLQDFSRLQNAGFELNIKPQLNMVELVARVIEQHIMSAPDYTLDLVCSENRLLVVGDEARLEQVLNNLISNAMKYSPKGSAVTICLERRDQEIVVWVRDKGLGIKAEHQTDIFKQFYRARTSQNKSIEGLGLGLFITHELVVKHGGRMWLESELGKGSTFYFALPFSEEG